MFKLFMDYMAVEDCAKEYICDMCGVIYESIQEKEKCYQSCIADVDRKINS